MVGTTLRALTSRTLAQRFAWILDARARCLAHSVRLRRRHAAYTEALARLRERNPAPAGPDRVFAGVDDDFWYWAIRESYLVPGALADLLPGFPPVAVQMGYTGAAGELTLWHAFNAYRMFRTLAADHGRPVPACRAVLDFGCGWGRINRFFLKDIAGDRLWGVDISAEIIDLCRRHDRWSRFAVVTPSGPTAFDPGAFDLVYAFSVYSHFGEEAHARWLAEIHRILAPGGLFMATTRPRDFIEQSVLDRLRRPFSSHPEAIAGRFADTRRWLAAYDEGRYCYEPLPGMVGWGEACIPREYVLRHWTRYFEILEFIDDPRRCPQNVIVARRAP